MVGSPPHTRGKALRLDHIFQDYRITPAHAGKSGSPPPCGGCCRDHPRACGEKFTGFFQALIVKGSPPRVRGKENLWMRSAPNTGITPARAGKSPVPASTPERIWDHPRTRGEKLPSLLMSGSSSGSPPHTRGKVMVAKVNHQAIGITPAHAGKRLDFDTPDT